jgi:hypothetical protein
MERLTSIFNRIMYNRVVHELFADTLQYMIYSVFLSGILVAGYNFKALLSLLDIGGSVREGSSIDLIGKYLNNFASSLSSLPYADILSGIVFFIASGLILYFVYYELSNLYILARNEYVLEHNSQSGPVRHYLVVRSIIKIVVAVFTVASTALYVLIWLPQLLQATAPYIVFELERSYISDFILATVLIVILSYLHMLLISRSLFFIKKL